MTMTSDHFPVFHGQKKYITNTGVRHVGHTTLGVLAAYRHEDATAATAVASPENIGGAAPFKGNGGREERERRRRAGGRRRLL